MSLPLTIVTIIVDGYYKNSIKDGKIDTYVNSEKNKNKKNSMRNPEIIIISNNAVNEENRDSLSLNKIDRDIEYNTYTTTTVVQTQDTPQEERREEKKQEILLFLFLSLIRLVGTQLINQSIANTDCDLLFTSTVLH